MKSNEQKEAIQNGKITIEEESIVKNAELSEETINSSN